MGESSAGNAAVGNGIRVRGGILRDFLEAA